MRIESYWVSKSNAHKYDDIFRITAEFLPGEFLLRLFHQSREERVGRNFLTIILGKVT
jgi:hypothetical protein